jgi:hypothetical protein
MNRHFLVIALCLGISFSAEASIYTLNAVGGYECAEDMSTDDCFSAPTATSWSGPVPTLCNAWGRNKQRCKNCEPAYYSDGQPIGHSTCNYVATNAACDCTPAGAAKCTGNTSSTCSYAW